MQNISGEAQLRRIGVRCREIAASGHILRAGIAVLALAGAGWAGERIQSGAHQAAAAGAELRAKNAEIAQLRAEVSRMRGGLAVLSRTVEATTLRIEARDRLLAAALTGSRAAAHLTRVAAPSVPAMPEADGVLAPLARLEGAQLALVTDATAAARARYFSAATTIRGLGLDPRRFTRARYAVGGPFEPVTGPVPPASPKADARVEDLYQAWAKLSQLGQATSAIPSRMPVTDFNYTSHFGVRYDPFNGAAAMHAGVDLAGPYGEPIAAAAPGTVVSAGWKGGYGNCVEIAHGNGLSTRYGHLSRIAVHVGETVGAGDTIGAMGSTGRSTGSHLHFEVRVDGRAVDPMPYLRAMPQMAALQKGGVAVGGPLLAARP